MISINLWDDHITVTGHAQKVACEAITAVTQTVTEYIESNLSDTPKMRLESGYFEIWTSGLESEAAKILKSYLEFSLCFIASGFFNDIHVQDFRRESV